MDASRPAAAGVYIRCTWPGSANMAFYAWAVCAHVFSVRMFYNYQRTGNWAKHEAVTYWTATSIAACALGDVVNGWGAITGPHL